MAKFYSVFVLDAVLAAVGVVSAITDEEKSNIHSAIVPIVTKCGEELGISKEEILASKQAKNPDALNSCFYACFFKELGIINDKGEFNPATAKELHKKYLHDENDVTKLDAISDICTSVNSQAVSDGAKGCERSKLLVKCFIENKENFAPILSE